MPKQKVRRFRSYTAGSYRQIKGKPRTCEYILRFTTNKRCQRKPIIQAQEGGWYCTQHFNELYEARRVHYKH